jgi:hypothetical protein
LVDLFSQHPDNDFERLLALWPRSVSGPLLPIGMSAFGDVYWERRTGEIQRLDILEGGVQGIAANMDEFKQLMNSQQWQEDNLLSHVVALLTNRGLRPGGTQCYALVPHPVFSGRIDFDRAMVIDVYPWHVICSQLLDAPSKESTS